MKIQTQTRLLIAGIVAVPLLVVLSMLIFRQYLDSEDISGLPVYEEISVEMQERFSAREWDLLMHNVARFRNLGDMAFFRNDLFVLNSGLPEFSTGDYATWESILPLLENQRFIFTSTGPEENHSYLLVKFENSSIIDRLIPFFLPALIGIIFIGILTLFAICMSIAIARTITNSVKVLENATRRIAEGELDFKVDVKGSNEIISLTHSLNKMRDALKEDELRRSRFIMGITHDLKTPLALIKGYAEAIEDGVADDAASRTGATEIIVAKADQLEEMIDDLINCVQMETGELRMRLEDINLPTFLQNMVKTLKNDVELLDHALIEDIKLPENISVPMDERLVLRAFENLTHNAVRYTPNGATIRFAALRLENIVELVISDNGPGIGKEDLPHIFEMFYRGSSSRREQGMGLGLAVVKWVVDYHGWAISVVSEKNKGTSFTISIPLAENAVKQ